MHHIFLVYLFLPLLSLFLLIRSVHSTTFPTWLLLRHSGQWESFAFFRFLNNRDIMYAPLYIIVLKVLCNLLAVDGVNDPDVLAINAGRIKCQSFQFVHFRKLLSFSKHLWFSYSLCSSGPVWHPLAWTHRWEMQQATYHRIFFLQKN